MARHPVFKTSLTKTRNSQFPPPSVEGPSTISSPDLEGFPSPAKPATMRGRRVRRSPARQHTLYRPQPLSEAVADSRMSVAGVVVEVMKEGELNKTGTLFDIVKVSTDESLTDPYTSRDFLIIKQLVEVVKQNKSTLMGKFSDSVRACTESLMK
ncbi:hypothetical protein GWK47_012038 [Chionoecetes opilio]|uniref:Uncharacterized protein n=1 Tax=Chionoecetes opilio TaxID=41210 RepID=A0A8J4Y5S6_CHIOP|nr:hypothetical protein GWK47_012038 [Chionoecetes opilio]